MTETAKWQSQRAVLAFDAVHDGHKPLFTVKPCTQDDLPWPTSGVLPTGIPHNSKEHRMNNCKPVVAAIFCLGAMLSTASYAGAGANMNACIYLPVAPIKPMSVSFVAGGSIDHCMNNTGNNATLTVSTAGVSCASVGYVEGKSSSSGGDTCATDTSVWLLSYSISNTAYSGSTQSTWSHPFLSDNHIQLQASSNGTSVCSNASLCTSTSQQWDSGTQGPLYIIFQPQAATAAAKDEIKVDGPAARAK